MKPRFPWRFVGTAFIAGWLVDLLFWGKIPGIAFPIWILILLGLLYFLAKCESIKLSRFSYALAGLVFLSALAVFLRGDWFSRVMGGLASLAGMMLLAGTFRSGNWFFYRIWEYMRMAFWETVAVFARPFLLLKDLIFPAGEPRSGSGWRMVIKRLAPVLGGFVLAIPILCVLIGLLASADLVFQQSLNDFLKIFELRRIPEYIFRALLVLFLTYWFIGLFLHAVHPQREETRPDNQKSWLKPFLGMTQSGIVLVLVDLLFLFFVLLQIRYLFGGTANIAETGYTYSEYARRGFGELMAVAILSLLMYLVFSIIIKMESTKKRVLFTVLTIILLALVLVILASAFQRLFLYENAYGFTRLRTYTHILIIWMAVLLLGSIGLEAFQKRYFFATGLLLVSFGFVLTLATINVDGFIARRNIAVRAEDGSLLDVSYLKVLSADATPILVRGYLAGGMSDSEKEELGAELACRTGMAEQAHKDRKWQSFNLAEQTEYRWLTAYQSYWIEQYPVWSEGMYWYVKVDGENTLCRPSDYSD